MSEELRQKGYLSSKGILVGDTVGELAGFNLGATTLNQLKNVALVPGKVYGKNGNLKPDALVVDRRGAVPDVRLVVEFKDKGELDSEKKRLAVCAKLASTYCSLLDCSVAAISDGDFTAWIAVSPTDGTWIDIVREDGYPLDVAVDLTSEKGRDLIARTLGRISQELDPVSGKLNPIEAVNPTTLAEETWQTIWLASGENPDACLASFVEILIFKFLSDLGILTATPSGVPVDFETVVALDDAKILRYYFDNIRPEIKRLFPPGPDKTSVINGIILNPSNIDHGRLFAQILSRFARLDKLRRIDPEFKSRIFERFLKKSISQTNWGQFFTPRNVVKAMVEMSGIEHLAPGSVVADPACGVGGFILEPLLNKRPHDMREAGAPSLSYIGRDRDVKTIILAKANMLVHLSEVLEKDPSGSPSWLGNLLNETFQCISTHISGSLSLVPRSEFDLVITNPPYVVRGSSTQRAMIAANPTLSNYYSVPGSGMENLFLQLIVNGLKASARALVVIPDGILLRHTEEALRRYILTHCHLEAIVSLPKDTFYSTPKKTYILVIRKKNSLADKQELPVFTYLIGAIGETRDAKRFVIAENHLPRMAELFRLFQGAPDVFEPPKEDGRIKIRPISAFQPEEHWLVDRWWSEEELFALGELEARDTISPEQLAERLSGVAKELQDLAVMVREQQELAENYKIRRVSIGDPKLFRLSIGKRVLKKALHGKSNGPIPLYSANVAEPFGHLQDSNLSCFGRPSVLWGIDGDFVLAVKEAGVKFAITDHCGRLEILDDTLDPSYCRAAIALARVQAFDRTLRPSLQRMKKLDFQVPVDDAGEFNLEAQQVLASRYDSVLEALADAERTFGPLAKLQPDVMLRAQESFEDGPEA